MVADIILFQWQSAYFVNALLVFADYHDSGHKKEGKEYEEGQDWIDFDPINGLHGMLNELQHGA